MPNVPTWVEPAVNAERRRLRETPRLAVLSSLVEAKIAAIKADPGRECGMSSVFRLPRHPPVRSSAVYGSGEGRLVLWQQVGAMSLVAAACGGDEDDSVEAPAPATTELAAPEVPEPAPGTVVEVAVESGAFPTLVAAVQAAGLVDVLSGEGPFTVFAPTEDAFS